VVSLFLVLLASLYKIKRYVRSPLCTLVIF
jgi:hypothetical protein